MNIHLYVWGEGRVFTIEVKRNSVWKERKNKCKVRAGESYARIAYLSSNVKRDVFQTDHDWLVVARGKRISKSSRLWFFMERKLLFLL